MKQKLMKQFHVGARSFRSHLEMLGIPENRKNSPMEIMEARKQLLNLLKNLLEERKENSLDIVARL